MNDDCFVVAFVSGKGGTGKTTLTANFAVELASAKHLASPEGKDWKNRILVIDNDYATGGASYLLAGGERLKSGAEAGMIHPQTCFYDCYTQKIPPSEVSPLRLMFEAPAVGEFEVAVLLNNLAWWKTPLAAHDEIELPDIEPDGEGEGFLDKSLLPYYEALMERFRREYDFIFIDSRGGADTRASVAAVVADSVIIVTEPGEVAGKQDLSFVHTLHSLAQAVHREVGDVSIIFNRVLDSERDKVGKGSLLNVVGKLPISQNVVEAYRNTQLIFETKPLDAFCIEAVKSFEKCFPNQKGICHAKRNLAETLLRMRNFCADATSVLQWSVMGLIVVLSLGLLWFLPGSGSELPGALGWLGIALPIAALGAGAVFAFGGLRNAFDGNHRSKQIGWSVGGVGLLIVSAVVAWSVAQGLAKAKADLIGPAKVEVSYTDQP